jgi:hypothetical protein
MRNRKNHTDANEDTESDDDGISRGLVRLVSRCLDAASADVCVECVKQLSSQLQVFTDASPYPQYYTALDSVPITTTPCSLETPTPLEVILCF